MKVSKWKCGLQTTVWNLLLLQLLDTTETVFNCVFCSITQCLLTCQNGGEEQSTSTPSLMYVKGVGVICFSVKTACIFTAASKEQTLALTSQVSLFHTHTGATAFYKRLILWFAGCFDSSCLNRDFHLHTCEYTKLLSHPPTLTDEDAHAYTQVCRTTHTHSAYKYTHIHTLINSHIPCMQNVMEKGSYKHRQVWWGYTNAQSNDHIHHCMQIFP